MQEWEELEEFLIAEVGLEPIVVNVNHEPPDDEENEFIQKIKTVGEEQVENEEHRAQKLPVEKNEEEIRCDALKLLKSKILAFLLS